MERYILQMAFGYKNKFQVMDMNDNIVEDDIIIDKLLENLYAEYSRIIDFLKKEPITRIETNKDKYNNIVKTRIIEEIFNSGFNIISDAEEVIEIYKQPFQTRAEITWFFNIEYDENGDNREKPNVKFNKIEKLVETKLDEKEKTDDTR